MTMDPITALLTKYWSQSLAQSALPNAPLVPPDRMCRRALRPRPRD